MCRDVGRPLRARRITLAQRLNELATANSEGLLRCVHVPNWGVGMLTVRASDDEYRLLRQNLFERFASNSQIPTEAPVVPISGGGHGASGSRGTSSMTLRLKIH